MHKRQIFYDNNDYIRFLFQITHFQSPKNFTNATAMAQSFRRNFLSNQPRGLIDERTSSEIHNARTIKLVAFALMPNHFHLLVQELSDGGIPFFMQRTQNGFTKYSNIKQETSGHLLQGPYRIIHIRDNDQLLYVSSYFHRNCRELNSWKNRERKYPWSSLQDYVTENRFGKLLATEIVLEQFNGRKEYEEFVASSSAKTGDETIKEIEF